jgi:signal transduction histidine kinase
MRYWLRGRFVSLLTYAVISALVLSALGWVTATALQMEEEKWQERADAQYTDKLHLALWRLDSRISPILAREDSRPYNHFSAIYAPSLALQNNGVMCSAGTVLEISPLVDADLPDWIALHFQADADSGWVSPQLMSPALQTRLKKVTGAAPADVSTKTARQQAFQQLAKHLQPDALLSRLREFEVPVQENTTIVLQDAQVANIQALNPGLPYQTNASPQPQPNQEVQGPKQEAPGQKVDREFLSRAGVYSKVKQESNGRLGAQNDNRDIAIGNTLDNGLNWFSTNLKRKQSEQVPIAMGTMVPVWLQGNDGEPRLVVARQVHIGERTLCQGILLDWPRLQKHLGEEVANLFPEARFVPVQEGLPQTERAMIALPVEMDPGPRPPIDIPSWTPMRIGLAMAWSAALVALLAVLLGGWTLLELSERRIRFVSAVTHELRTPLTTLRLYLDMLTGGIVQDEKQKAEYLQTLHTETERLNRLVGNVLDFSRLENQRPRLEMTRLAVSELLEQVRASWQTRCEGCDKLLIVEDKTAENQMLTTDVRLVPQIVGNLIDNACKYSKGADDRRIWLRAFAEKRRLVFEVEDRGPGVAVGERRSIFRAFRRGRDAETTGGVGLGLALAQRWAGLLGGQLVLRPGTEGACFRLELPLS